MMQFGEWLSTHPMMTGESARKREEEAKKLAEAERLRQLKLKYPYKFTKPER